MDAPFEVIMQQAAKLKTDQMAPNRRKYDASPMWYQHSLFSVDAIIKARDTLSFPELYQYGVDLKDIGNLEYKEGNMLGAMNEYEKALSLFKWLKPLREDWKKRGLDDTEMEACCYHPKSEEERKKIATLNCQCLINIAMCTQQTKEWSVSIRACDTVLNEIDCKCAKALYRRAQARSIPLSCGATENYIALDDMKAALRHLNEQNDMGAGSDWADGDQVGVRVINSNALIGDIPVLYNRILADYKELSAQLQKAKQKDKSRNTKIFNVAKSTPTPTAAAERPAEPTTGTPVASTHKKTSPTTATATASGSGGIYYTPEDEKVPSVEEYNKKFESEGRLPSSGTNGGGKGCILPPGSSRLGRETGATPKSVDDLTLEDVQTQMRDMEAAALRYETDRQFLKARELRAKVAKMKTIIEEHATKEAAAKAAKVQAQAQMGGGEAGSLPDFSNPTPEMVEEARRLHGLDLTDPRVKEMLAALQQEHKSSGGGPAAASGSGGKAAPGTAAEPPDADALARSLRTAEYKRIADKFLEEYTTKEALRPLLYNRHYNGRAKGFRPEEALRLDLSGHSVASLREYCVACLVADWHHLAAVPGIGGEKKGRVMNKADDTGIERVMDNDQLETVLMLYLPAPDLTVDILTVAFSGGGNKDLLAYLQGVTKRQLLTFLSSGTTPYFIGMLISLFCMFLYYSLNRSDRVYNPAVNVFDGSTQPSAAYGSL